MEKLGQLLKAEREKKGLSLHEIGMSLKINPKILKAIEDNDNSNLPAKTFLRGFVRSYAQYLRIDVDHALKLFQEEYGSTRPEEVRTAQNENSSTPSSSESTAITSAPKYEKPLKKTEDIALPKQSGGRWVQIIAAILILVTIAFVVKMIDKYQKESEIAQEAMPETNPIDVPTTTLAAQASDMLATPVTTTVAPGGMSAVPSSTSTTMAVPAAAAVSTTILTTTTTTLKAATTTTTVKVTTTSTTMKLTTTTTSTTMKPSTTTMTNSTTTTLASSAKMVEVIVEALNSVQVKYTLGDESAKTMDLSPDQVHTFKSKKVQLDITDGGAVNIIVNGRDRGVPGTIGKPLKITFP